MKRSAIATAFTAACICVLFLLLQDESPSTKIDSDVDREQDNTDSGTLSIRLATPEVFTDRHEVSSLHAKPIPVEFEAMIYNHPAGAYDLVASSAYSGDPDAMLDVAMVMVRCEHYYPDSKIRELESQSINGEALISRLWELNNACKPLAKATGNQEADIELEVRKWMEAAAEKQNPIAEAFLLRRKVRVSDSSIDTVYRALNYAVDRNMYLDQAIAAAYFHYASSIEELPSDYEISKAYKRGPRRDAWNYLLCKYDNECSIDQFMEHMETNYYVYEVDEMLVKVSEYESAIFSKDWDQLELQ